MLLLIKKNIIITIENTNVVMFVCQYFYYVIFYINWRERTQALLYICFIVGKIILIFLLKNTFQVFQNKNKIKRSNGIVWYFKNKSKWKYLSNTYLFKKIVV